MTRRNGRIKSDHVCGLICAAAVALGPSACGSGGSRNAFGGAPETTGGAPASGMASGGDAGSGAVGHQNGGGAPAGATGGAAAGDAGASGGGDGGASSSGSQGAAGGSGAPANGGADPGPEDAGSEITLDELPMVLSDASCSALERCLGSASGRFFDGGTCKGSLGPSTAEGSASLFAELVAKGTLAYDPAKVDECLANTRASGCDYPARRFDALCPGMLVGKAALGGACSINAECGDGAYCKATACPGTCTPLVAEGGACAADDDCADGLVCDANSKKCLVPGKKGDACSDAAPCGSAFVCDTSAHCVEFGSIFVAGQGQPCDPDGQVLCEASLTCALVGIDAQQKGVWSCEKPATGSACHVALPEQCAAGSYCELGGTLDGTCKTAPEDSAACASRLPSDPTVAKDICAPGLTCWSDGRCHARAHLREACTADDDCYSGTCTNEACAAAPCAP